MEISNDTEWLGLEQDAPGRWSFELVPELTRFDSKFYGGTGIALTTALLEAETRRHALWATVQFVGSATVGDRIECTVEELARGRKTSQVRITATVDGRVMLAAIGASGFPMPDALSTQFGSMPVVPPASEVGPWRPNVPFPVSMDGPSWLRLAEIREVRLPNGVRGMWARMRDHRQTRASLGFLADMVPSGVVQAAGRAGAGTSLDNAMRFGKTPDTEWILVEFDPYLIHGGYCHGAGRIWSEDGTLLGIASQTASMILFD